MKKTISYLILLYKPEQDQLTALVEDEWLQSRFFNKPLADITDGRLVDI